MFFESVFEEWNDPIFSMFKFDDFFFSFVLFFNEIDFKMFRISKKNSKNHFSFLRWNGIFFF